MNTLNTHPIDADTFDASIELDSPFRIAPAAGERGAVVETPLADIFAPDVYIDCDSQGNVLSGAESALIADLRRQGWEAFGETAQQGGGRIFHPSEALSHSGLARQMIDDGGTYAACEVRGAYPEEVSDEQAMMLDDNPIGWILLRQIDPLRVWVVETGAAFPRWVANELDDMRGNFADLVGDGLAPADGFGAYLDTWQRLDMPRAIFTGDDALRDMWIDEQVGR